MSNDIIENTCLNCGHPIKLNYCEQCGQDTSTQKIDWKFCSRELLFNNFTLHNKMLFTMKALLINPKKMIFDYINGKRIQYSGAIQFLFFVLILNGLIFVILGKPVDDNKTILEINAVKQSIDLRQYTKLVILMFILMSSLGSRLLYYKHKYTIPEHVIINFYTISFCWLFSSLLKLLTWNYFSGVYSWISLLLILIYYQRIFSDGKSLFKNFLKALSAILLILFFSFIVIVIGAIFVALYYQYIVGQS